MNHITAFPLKIVGLFFSLLWLFGCQVSSPPTTSNANLAAAKTRVELGLAYLSQGNLALAKANLDKAQQHAPKDYLPYLGLAYFYQHTSQNQLAEDNYQKALHLAPNNGDILNNYATFLCKQRQFTSAFQFFDQALSSKAYYHFADTYENIAICAHFAQDQTRLSNALTQLTKYAPEKAEVLRQRIKVQ